MYNMRCFIFYFAKNILVMTNEWIATCSFKNTVMTALLMGKLFLSNDIFSNCIN